MSFPNRGEGGGSPTWEKFPHFPVFLFGERPFECWNVEGGRCMIVSQDFATSLNCQHSKLSWTGREKRQCRFEERVWPVFETGTKPSAGLGINDFAGNGPSWS